MGKKEESKPVRERIAAKSVMIGRRPDLKKKKGEQWIAIISFFKENNPHLKVQVPFRVLEYEYTEKVRVRDLRNISYYLAGNDLVINNLLEATVTVAGGIITVTGKQELPKG